MQIIIYEYFKILICNSLYIIILIYIIVNYLNEG